jgi:formylglycine-generating enzyme
MTCVRPWLAVAAGLVVIAMAPRASADDELSLDLGGARLDLRRIPKGTFTQGSAAAEHGHEKDEEAARSVTITHDFWLGKVPVTRGQFARFASDARYVTEAEKGQSGGFGWDGKQLVQQKEFTWRNPGFAQGDDHPVVLVTFGDATAFAAWAARKTGKRVRLPTEAEYEYAARARTTTPWYGGPSPEDALATGWFKTNAGVGTHPVAQKKPNAFGLFDMAGNVYEWCRDVYVPTYPGKPVIDPETTQHAGPDAERRVLRGGSWLKDPRRGRSAARFRSTPGSRNADYGFRVLVADDDVVAPTVGGGGADFAPWQPVPLGSESGAVTTRPPDGAAPTEKPSPTMGWLLVVAPLAVGGLVVAWMLARRRGSASSGRNGATTRAGEDGFFVKVPGAAPGSRVKYVCIVSGAEVSDDVLLEGEEETFVYTGASPSAVQILAVASAPARVASVAVDPAAEREEVDDDASPPPSLSPSPPPVDEPFLGTPRAY